MQLTVLGAYGPYPPAGKACSGYLLEDGETKIMLDCGNGTLSRLQAKCHPWELQAVVISHLHSDHISDLFILRYALDMAVGRGDINGALKIYLPADPLEEFNRISYKEVFQLNKITADSNFVIGPFLFTCLRTVHPLETYAYKITAGNKTLIYSADTEYYPALEDFVAGCDLFLCEANYLEHDMPKPNHLSAGQAGKIAADNRVQKLLITHLPPIRDPEEYLREARTYYSAAEIAREGETYQV